MDSIDYLRFYSLEAYLFEDISPRFAETGRLEPMDLLAIGEWKAARARSYLVDRLVSVGEGSIDRGVQAVAAAASLENQPENRFKMFFGEFGFRLPMASAILTVLDPANFTVYDQRVCNQLGRFHELANWVNVENTWAGYQEYRTAVREAAPSGLALRDCDRWLWAKDLAEGLDDVIQAARTQKVDSS